jgi:hypothetical protein
MLDVVLLAGGSLLYNDLCVEQDVARENLQENGRRGKDFVNKNAS